MTAIWTAPRTWGIGDLTTASMMNQHIRDNFDFLKTPPANTPATFSTLFTTTSTTFTDLPGMTATLTSFGGGFDVFLTLKYSTSGGNIGAVEILCDGVAESGGLSQGIAILPIIGAGVIGNFHLAWHITAKAAGTHTIKVQVLQATAGTLSIYGTANNNKPQFYVVERGA